MTSSPEFPSVEAFTRYLALVALFGCARHDATPEQVARLRNEAVPMLRDQSNPVRWVVERVFDIMGPDWNPLDTGNGHGDWLRRLLEEKP